jgi:hypothetical protein
MFQLKICSYLFSNVNKFIVLVYVLVADGSGSMSVNVGDTNVMALSVANALAIYFAERSLMVRHPTDPTNDCSPPLLIDIPVTAISCPDSFFGT